MTMIGKDFPVRANAFCLSSEKRVNSAAMSPAETLCFDIFPPLPGDSDVISQIERLCSKETNGSVAISTRAGGPPPSIRRAWAGSPPFARSANMPGKSGTFPCGRPEEDEMRWFGWKTSSDKQPAAAPRWRIGDEAVQALLEARHPDPFAVLGPHETPDGIVIRALVPHAEQVTALPGDGPGEFPLMARGGGFFEGLVNQRKNRFPY